MLSHVCLLALCLIFGLAVHAQAAPDPNYIVNGGFENELTGWTAEGDVHLDRSNPLVGKASVSIGPGKGAIRQGYGVAGLRIVEFGATARFGSPEIEATVRVQCFDSHNRQVMDLKQPFDAKKVLDKKGVGSGIYFKTQAHTAYIVVSIEKTSDKAGTVTADSVELHDYDEGRKEHKPECDLDQYMQPIWQGGPVYNETVLLLSERGGPASGRLLYKPVKILSVKDSTLHTEFTVGKDYAVQGNVILKTSGSKMTSMADTDFPKGDFPWLSVAGKHIVVTYTHDDSWTGPPATYQGDRLPQTIQKLQGRKPLTIVALGDSITLGINVSGYRNEPPYMPTWVDLFATELGKVYRDTKVKVFNTGLGGMTAQWGQDNAKDAVASLNPDLVLIGFGMNDFWSVEPEAFGKSIAATMSTVREKRPNAEFILISSIGFDPAYTIDPLYTNHMAGYHKQLLHLVGPGVGLLDMTTLTKFLYEAKGAKGLMADPMHPDDFLARFFAQYLVAMLMPEPSLEPHKLTKYFVAPTGDDSADGHTAKHAFRSLERVAEQILGPGDEVILASGATFKGHLDLKLGEHTEKDRPVVIRSVGAPATIISPSQAAISARTGGLVIKNLVLEGEATVKKDGHDGISLIAEGTGEQGPVLISHVDVSGFGGSGISIGAGKDSLNGFRGLRIENVSAHDNFGTGIQTEDGISWTGKGYAHRNLTITDCDVSRNRSGSGMVISGVDGANIECCRASDNTGFGGGVGIWAWAAKHVTIRNCISKGTHTGGGDGGGFDLDGGCEYCVVDQCLAYDNDGPGYMHCDYPGAPWTHGNAIKNSVSIDDGRKKKGDNIGFGFVTWGSGLDECVIEDSWALVSAPDSLKRENGALFVSYIPTNDSKDKQHIRDCEFRSNWVSISGSGVAFVRNGLQNPTPSNVRFELNQYNSKIGPSFVEGAEGQHIYKTLDQWRSATGQEAQLLGKKDFSLWMGSMDFSGYKTWRPRDLAGRFSPVRY